MVLTALLSERMAKSKYPSKVNLPQENLGWQTVLDFLVDHFKGIDKNTWLQRIQAGKVHWINGDLVESNTPYRAQAAVYYYREVIEEPKVPFEHKIIYQDKQILIVDKPHFLPVTPGGQYVNECLQHRLRKETGIDKLQALHRLDRETAGLVMFSVNPETRSNYHALFSGKTITKTYLAIAKTKSDISGKRWEVRNKMIKAQPSFLMQIDKAADEASCNAHSIIRCIKQNEHLATFELQPITGKTHQLRVHMQSIGFPILNDKFYPKLQPKTAETFENPLQLLATTLQFVDPITKENREFKSSLVLID